MQAAGANGAFPLNAWGVSLAFASEGTAYLAHILESTLFVAVRSPGGAWIPEYGGWDAGVSMGIRTVPTGNRASRTTGSTTRRV